MKTFEQIGQLKTWVRNLFIAGRSLEIVYFHESQNTDADGRIDDIQMATIIHPACKPTLVFCNPLPINSARKEMENTVILNIIEPPRWKRLYLKEGARENFVDSDHMGVLNDAISAYSLEFTVKVSTDRIARPLGLQGPALYAAPSTHVLTFVMDLFNRLFIARHNAQNEITHYLLVKPTKLEPILNKKSSTKKATGGNYVIDDSVHADELDEEPLM